MSDTPTETTADDGPDILAALDHIEAEAVAGESASEGEFMPGNNPQDEKEPSLSTADVIAPLLKITFGLIAHRRGPHWQLEDAEAAEAGKAYGDVIDKYFPDVAMGCEVTAVFCTLALVGPRVAEDRMVAQKEAETEQKAKPNHEKEN